MIAVMERLADRLRTRAARHFVGRADELALFESSLAGEAPDACVFVLHGPGGVGKTSLVEQVRRLAGARGFESLRLDARDIEPTPSGLLRALGAALELEAADCTLGRVLDRWSERPRRLLVFDTFERAAPLEGWLRRTLLPELPQDTRVILAGRSLDPAWQTEALWREGARVLALRNLAPHHCERYLAARGVPGGHHAAIVALSRGHPLALTLLADVVLATGQVPQGLGTDLVRQLAERFTAQAETDLHRRALEVCAHVRITTEPLIADAVDREQAPALFRWLAGLSFVEASPAGLFPHDLVREAIDDELYWRDRPRYREIHLAVRRHLVQRALAGSAQASAHTFDILYLHRRSAVTRPFVDYGALGSMFFERAQPGDLPLLRSLARSELPAAQQAAVEHWFSHPAAETWAVRPSPGELAAAFLSIDLARWNLAAGGQRRPSAAMNGLQMAQFYVWLTDARLGCFVICVEEPRHWAPFMAHVDFEPLPGCELELDGLRLGCYAHDWRRRPLPEWSKLMADRELGEAGTAPPAGSADAGAGALDREAFARAVRDALRAYVRPADLAASPLLGGPLVARAAQPGEDGTATLRRLLLDAAQALRERPRDQKFWRALELTYFRPVGSQELAAERLGLPFGTYRYQLATGIDRVVDALWQQSGQA